MQGEMQCDADLDLLDTFESENLFMLDGLLTYAKISRIYDGDSFVVNIPDPWREPHRKEIISFKARLNGVDTPEIRTRCAIEKGKAQSAKQIVEVQTTNCICTIKCHRFDKYGRVLVDVLLPDGSDLAIKLLDLGLAVPYGGGKKTHNWSHG